MPEDLLEVTFWDGIVGIPANCPSGCERFEEPDIVWKRFRNRHFFKVAFDIPCRQGGVSLPSMERSIVTS